MNHLNIFSVCSFLKKMDEPQEQITITPLPVSETDAEVLSKLPDALKDLFEVVLLSSKIKEL